MRAVGKDIPRIEGADKVTGRAKYNDDYSAPGLLYAKTATSPYAHAQIVSIDLDEARSAPGVLAILTGEDYPQLYGQILEDRPVLALGKVRYCGEPVALVVAHSEAEAAWAAGLVKVHYQPLPVVPSPSAALEPSAPLIHEDMGRYGHFVAEAYPEPGSNVAHRVKIRKGDMAKGWSESDVVIESRITIPQTDHAAMETRSAIVEIMKDGRVIVHTPTQAPFGVKKLMSHYFNLDVANVIVETGLVGGAFGGKTTCTLELLAYLASKAVDGRPVKIANTREEDIMSAPCHIGLEAKLKLGGTRDGEIVAADMTYLLDIGAYTDSGPTMAKAIAAACTGPYNIANVSCDALAVYTNHTYVTAFRGFGHGPLTFAMERAMDKLAATLQMDPVELRYKNAIAPGNLSPTQDRLNASSLGNVIECITKMRQLIQWEDGRLVDLGNHKVRAKGLACFWKTSSSPVNAISGVLLAMNQDGTINLNCGVVELGQGTKTALAQILAEKMKMDVGNIHVVIDVNTEVSPEHWKTVASKSLYMAGNAVVMAAEDLTHQLRAVGAIVLRCPPIDLEVGDSRVYMRADPTIYVDFKDIAHGYTYDNGNAIGGQLMARGTFIMPHLTKLNQDTGKGISGPAWTVGCQAVEVEFDRQTFTHQVKKAATVIDVGKAINPRNAKAVLKGAMCMGLGLGLKEKLDYRQDGMLVNRQLRTYKLMRCFEQPQYLVEFVETPELDSAFGQRGIAEHGLLAIPAALASALSTAAEVELNELPLTPETIWRAKTGGKV